MPSSVEVLDDGPKYVPSLGSTWILPLPLLDASPSAGPGRSFGKAAARPSMNEMNRDGPHRALLHCPFTLLLTGRLTALCAGGKRTIKCLLLLRHGPGLPPSVIWWCENYSHSPFSGEVHPKTTGTAACLLKTSIKIVEFITKEVTNVLEVTSNDAIQQSFKNNFPKQYTGSLQSLSKFL